MAALQRNKGASQPSDESCFNSGRHWAAMRGQESICFTSGRHWAVMRGQESTCIWARSGANMGKIICNTYRDGQDSVQCG